MSGDAKPREPAWIGKLSRMGVTAERMQGKSKGTFGAANSGRRLFAWSCACGWQGTSRELKAGPDGLACPMCGGGGLRPKG
jgi:hypothetical protein